MKIKTIKIIDLFNMLANFEEMPKKIKCWGVDYSWNQFDKDYQESSGELLFGNMKGTYHLNDEVEIIEEEKVIEKLGKNFTFEDSTSELTKSDWQVSVISQKINELVDEINKLKKEKK